MGRATMRIAVTALGLALVLSAPARAQNANKPDSFGRPPTKGEETVRGVIAGITTIGETAVNSETGRAEVAEAAILTVIGSPDWGHCEHDGDKNKDTAQAPRNKEHGRAARRRDNRYILAITPRTKVQEASGWSKEAINSAATASLEQIELGDDVQETFRPFAHGREAKPTTPVRVSPARRPVLSRTGAKRSRISRSMAAIGRSAVSSPPSRSCRT